MTKDYIITDLELIENLSKAGLTNIPGPCLYAGKWISNVYYPSGAIQHMAGEWERNVSVTYANPAIEWHKQPNIYELLKYLITEKKMCIEFGPQIMTIKATDAYLNINQYYNMKNPRITFEEFLEQSFKEYFEKYIRRYLNTY